jgi:hypothetical protein
MLLARIPILNKAVSITPPQAYVKRVMATVGPTVLVARKINRLQELFDPSSSKNIFSSASNVNTFNAIDAANRSSLAGLAGVRLHAPWDHRSHRRARVPLQHAQLESHAASQIAARRQRRDRPPPPRRGHRRACVPQLDVVRARFRHLLPHSQCARIVADLRRRV